MIKKITLFLLVAALSWNSALYADYMGGMGPCVNAFLSLEGSYTINSLKGFHFNFVGFPDEALFSKKKNQPWGGRIAAGVLWRAYEELAFSAELGWGYYGQTRFNPVGTGVFFAPVLDIISFSVTHNLTGIDLLVGASFLTPCYSLFLKAGPLLETDFSKFEVFINPFPFPPVEFTLRNTRTSVVLPAIKVGGSYIFNEYWSLTVSYMHAFGHKVFTTGTIEPIGISIATLDIGRQVPSLSSLMVGIQFLI